MLQALRVDYCEKKSCEITLELEAMLCCSTVLQ